MRGYFAIGIEGASKPGNMGNLIRTAHGFGAAFVFTLDPQYDEAARASLGAPFSDTSETAGHVPFYEFERIEDMVLPKGCTPVGVEITDDAKELPSFRHPLQAAYILGSERFSLSESLIEHCEFVIKIPTKFSLNVATAGAIVMYDRMISLGRFGERPVSASGDVAPLPEHVRGAQTIKRTRK